MRAVPGWLAAAPRPAPSGKVAIREAAISAIGEVDYQGNIVDFVEFIGEAIPGFSGGPVLDLDGSVVAMMHEAWTKRGVKGGCFPMPKLNFDLLPSREEILRSQRILRGLPESIDERLAALPATRNRARGAILLAEEANTKGTQLWRQAAFLRGSLGEFRAIEFGLKEDRPEIPPERRYKLTHSTNPLLHLLKLLRDFNVHHAKSSLKPGTVRASLNEHAFDFPIVTISDLSDDSLLQTRDAGEYYGVDDLRLIVEWFNESQLHWGAPRLAALATERLCEEILEAPGASEAQP